MMIFFLIEIATFLKLSPVTVIKADVFTRLERWAKISAQPYSHVKKIAARVLNAMTPQQVIETNIYDLVESIVVKYNVATLSSADIQRDQNNITEMNEGKNTYVVNSNIFGIKCCNNLAI